MKDVNVPFSLYDFFAILFPGFFGAVSIYLFVDPSLRNLSHYLQGLQGMNDFVLAAVLIVACYFTGHIFNALGQYFVERTATRFLGWTVNNYLAMHGILRDRGIRGFVVREKRLRLPKRIFEYIEGGKEKPTGALIKSCVETVFGKINQEYGHVYRLIHSYVTQFAPDSAGEAKVFSATAAMFESLTVAFAFAGIALFVGIFSGQVQAQGTAWVGIVAFALSVLCFNSSRRYKRMWVETIYAAFVSVVKSQMTARKSL